MNTLKANQSGKSTQPWRGSKVRYTTAKTCPEESELTDPGRVLTNSGHTTLTRYLLIEEPPAPPSAALIAVGRYNDLLDAWVADEPSQWPSLSELLATFALAEQEDCACSLPIWPST